MNALARRACALLEANGIAPYDDRKANGAHTAVKVQQKVIRLPRC